MIDVLRIARKVVSEEAEALRQVADGIDAAFEAAVRCVLDSRGHVVVSGLGKSGNIAQKIAASLTSTGTPAMFMHPVEALHGDLGRVADGDVLLVMSRSGNTPEIVRFTEHFRRLGGPVIGLTQGRESRLAELCTHTLFLPDLPESGPLQLAPTTSCVMMLAVGDALAMALLHARGFRSEDFAQYHPEGSLGRRLLLRAEDVMHKGDDLPLVRADEPFRDLIHHMTVKQLGLAIVVGDDGELIGTFTDGDLRRIFERVADPLALDARGAFERSRRESSAPPVRQSTVSPELLAIDCLRLMRESQITSLVVVDGAGRPVGVLRLMDLIREGLG
ncbi:MAG: KpsF/GutQ family sugar-phosphate isomerase [Planctomycetota bacterium]|nr:MAG: KpsF/GutQ family sugar-phosphate isomerase [Planctomycetota bacterium]